MTPEQLAAFALIDQVLQPSTVAQLAAQGSRESWLQINAAVEALRPLFISGAQGSENPDSVSD